MSNITEVSKGFKLTNPGPLDALYGPYSSVEAACLAVPNVEKLVDGVVLNFRTGRVVGIRGAEGIVEYWWKSGVLDRDLNVKEDLSKALLKSDFVLFGKNKIDKLKIARGLYSSLGVLTNSTGKGIHISNVPDIDFTKKYIVTGQRNNSAAVTRAVIRNSSGGLVKAIMSNATSDQLLDLSGGDISGGVAVRLDLNISDDYTISGGISPTNNIYSNAAMLRLEGMPSGYESFIEGVPVVKVIGAAKQADLELSNIEITKIKADVGASIKKIDLIKIGKNKANKLKVGLGVFNSAGQVGATSGKGIHILNIPDINFTKKYRVYGQRNNSASFVRGVTKNILGGVVQLIMSNGLNEQLIDMSLGNTTNGLPVTFDVAIANDWTLAPQPIVSPTDNGWVNVFMVHEEGTDNTYEAYKESIPVTKLTGVAREEDLNVVKSTAEQVKAFTDVISSGYVKSYLFDGTASFKLNKTYTLIANGDYVEIESRFNGAAANDGLGLMGMGLQVTSNVFGYYAANSIWLRERKLNGTDPSPAYIAFSGLPVLNVFRKIKLLVAGSNYELYIDGILVGTQPFVNGIYIDNIGESYTTYKVLANIKSFTIHTASETAVIQDFSTGTNVKTAYDKIEDKNSSGYPEFFYEVYPTGATGGYPKVICYTKRGGAKNTYVGHEIIRQVDLDEILYIDYYRNVGAYNYKYNGTTMTKLETRALAGSENEFTMLFPGKNDHTGGVHGDEVYKNIQFTADGHEIDLNIVKPLTACCSLSYHVVSDLKETVSIAEPTVPIPGHPTVAEHIKTIIFGEGGYRAVNSVKNTKSTAAPTLKFYTGLICIYKDQATEGYTEISIPTPFVYASGSTDNQLFSTITREFYAVNKTTKLSCYATSRCVYPPEMDGQRQHFITDRVADTKYYSQAMGYTIPAGGYIIVEAILECYGDA